MKIAEKPKTKRSSPLNPNSSPAHAATYTPHLDDLDSDDESDNEKQPSPPHSDPSHDSLHRDENAVSDSSPSLTFSPATPSVETPDQLPPTTITSIAAAPITGATLGSANVRGRTGHITSMGNSSSGSSNPARDRILMPAATPKMSSITIGFASSQ
ncbi:hypothetical protein BGW38_009330, partial [Lunasporangiospora selenospora]